MIVCQTDQRSSLLRRFSLVWDSCVITNKSYCGGRGEDIEGKCRWLCPSPFPQGGQRENLPAEEVSSHTTLLSYLQGHSPDQLHSTLLYFNP